MKRTLITAIILALPLFAAACNTISGFGEDVKAGGNAVEKTAEKHQNY